MKIEVKYSRNDVKRVQDLVASMADHYMVVERRKRNVKRLGIDISHGSVWKKQIGCLLTTQQNSSENSAVQRFIRSNSPLLSLRKCEKVKNVERFAESELSAFGGIRRTTVIPKQIAYNFNLLTTGGWDDLDLLLSQLRKAPQSKETERTCAARIDNLLKGFGPKQSRNLLQWLGLTQHEIPIDSRIIRWLKELGNSNSLRLLSSAALSETDYYCCIMDGIQSLCEEANVLPCIFDASVFASFEKRE